ncbi:MAG: DUF2953 domain-containing protein [Nitrososphaerota archaeon]|nr:DUF2953 domain-containing protein [Nitrososphaerota archaeon]
MIDIGLLGLVILAVVLSLLVVGASATLIPSRLFFTITKQGPVSEGRLVVRWLGLKVVDRQLFGPPKVEVVGREREQRIARIKHSLHMLRLSGRALPHLVPVFKSFFKSVTFEGMSGEIKFGLEDPVDTAVVYGFIASAVAVASAIPRSMFVATPIFGEQVFDGNLKAELRVTPFRLVVALIKAYRHKPIRLLFKEMSQG